MKLVEALDAIVAQGIDIAQIAADTTAMLAELQELNKYIAAIDQKAITAGNNFVFGRYERGEWMLQFVTGTDPTASITIDASMNGTDFMLGIPFIVADDLTTYETSKVVSEGLILIIPQLYQFIRVNVTVADVIVRVDVVK